MAAAAQGASAHSAGAAPAVSALPKLKPIISKPFPEGASEQAVCEAIHDTDQSDVWVRFGHLVPVYVTGALFVLEAGPAQAKRLKRFVEKDYVRPRLAQQAHCGDHLTLLYQRSLLERSAYKGEPFGRKHLSQVLEAQLNIKTRESFHFDYSKARLADYCGTDAKLCDALRKLDIANDGLGVCADALLKLRVSPEEAEWEKYAKGCRNLGPKPFACAVSASPGEPHGRCVAQMQSALGIEPPATHLP